MEKKETRGRKTKGIEAMSGISISMKRKEIDEMKKRAKEKKIPVSHLVRDLVLKGLGLHE